MLKEKEGTTKIRKAVIPAAGWGTRFLPAAKDVPKEMLPVVDKPPIHYVVEDAVAAGCDIIYIISGRGKEAIQRYFGRSPELEYVLKSKGKEDLLDEIIKISDIAEIVYLTQKEQKGLGDAIYCARNQIGDDDFHVLLGDDIVINPNGASCSEQLALVHKKYSSPVFGVQKVPKKDLCKFGIVDGLRFDYVNLNGPNSKPTNVYRVKRLIEKPTIEEAPSRLAIIGRYIFPAEIFRYIKDTNPGAGGEIQITDAMNELNKKMQFVACEFEGTRYDLGSKVDWLIANIELGMERDVIGPELKGYFKSQRFSERLNGRRLT